MGVADTDTALPAAVVDEALNEALQAITTERDWPWLYSEVSGTLTPATDTLALPADFGRSIFLSVQGNDIEPRSARDLARFRVDASGSPFYNQPFYYTQAGASLRLSPTPGPGTAYSYVLAYFKSEPTLVADGDVPLLPAPYHGWLVTRAALNLAIRTDNTTRLAKLEAEDARWMGRVVDNVRRSSQLNTIRRTKPSIWQDV